MYEVVKETIQYEILPSGLRLARCPLCWCSVQEKSRCRWQLSSWCNLVEFQIHLCTSISALLRCKAEISNLMIQKYLFTSWPPIQWFEMLFWDKSLPWFVFLVVFQVFEAKVQSLLCPSHYIETWLLWLVGEDFEAEVFLRFEIWFKFHNWNVVKILVFRLVIFVKFVEGSDMNLPKSLHILILR